MLSTSVFYWFETVNIFIKFHWNKVSISLRVMLSTIYMYVLRFAFFSDSNFSVIFEGRCQHNNEQCHIASREQLSAVEVVE